jgi:hypothetical protein
MNFKKKNMWLVLLLFSVLALNVVAESKVQDNTLTDVGVVSSVVKDSKAWVEANHRRL